jgi:hypothetical protein
VHQAAHLGHAKVQLAARRQRGGAVGAQRLGEARRRRVAAVGGRQGLQVARQVAAGGVAAVVLE